MKIIIILMITCIIYRIFLLLILSIADAKFSTVAQILSKTVVAMNSWGKSPRVVSVVALLAHV